VIPQHLADAGMLNGFLAREQQLSPVAPMPFFLKQRRNQMLQALTAKKTSLFRNSRRRPADSRAPRLLPMEKDEFSLFWIHLKLRNALAYSRKDPVSSVELLSSKMIS